MEGVPESRQSSSSFSGSGRRSHPKESSSQCRRMASAQGLPPAPPTRATPAAGRYRRAFGRGAAAERRRHLLGPTRAVGSSGRGGGAEESSRSCSPRAEASACAWTPRLSSGGVCAPSPPLRPGPTRGRASAAPSLSCPGSHPSPSTRLLGKLRPRVGTCTELQAGAVAARAAGRGGPVPDDGGEGR